MCFAKSYRTIYLVPQEQNYKKSVIHNDEISLSLCGLHFLLLSTHWQKFFLLYSIYIAPLLFLPQILILEIWIKLCSHLPHYIEALEKNLLSVKSTLRLEEAMSEMDFNWSKSVYNVFIIFDEITVEKLKMYTKSFEKLCCITSNINL